jgi:hypothetical protein
LYGKVSLNKAEDPDMRVDDALRQIEAIHEQLDKGEVYRGFQVGGVAAAGVLGLAAAALQDRLVDGQYFLHYWIAVATVCAFVAGGSALFAFIWREDAWARRKTLRLLCQFIPCVIAGTAITWVFAHADLMRYLPGLWAIVFGLGLLAARPYLPRATGWVCLFYLACGCGLLARAAHGAELSGWQVGGVFGLGHLASALVLSRNVERDQNV